MKCRLSILLTITMLVGMFFQMSLTVQVNAIVQEYIAVAVEPDTFSDTNVGEDGENTLLWTHGSASTTGGLLRVAPNTGGGGTVVRRNQIHITDGFSTYFQIKIGDHIGDAGDGMAFVIYKADEPQLGEYGGGLGYGGIDDSIAVEFDTYNNSDFGDGAVAHGAIMVNGNNRHTAQPEGSKAAYNAIKNGVEINVWIDYNAGTMTATFGTGATKADDANVTITRNVSSDVSLSDEDVFVGFSAATGGARSNHDVLKWYFKDSYVEGGLSSAENAYYQAPSAVALSLDQNINPTSVTMAVYDEAGGTMNNQELNIYIDDSFIETINTGDNGSCEYSINGLAAGEHRIRAVASGGASNFKDFTISVAAPAAPVLQSANAGNGYVALSWNDVNGADGYKVYKSTESGVYDANAPYTTVSSSVYNCEVTGLTNNITYYFSVKATNSGGDSAYSNELSAVPHSTSGGGGGGGGSSSTPQTPQGGIILVNGKEENAGTSTNTTQGNQTVTTITVDQEKLEQKLASEGNGAVVTIPVNSSSDIVIGELNGQMVKNMETKEAVLEVKTGNAAYILPAHQINIDAVSQEIGTQIALQDIKVQIEISKPADETVKIVENSAKSGEFTIIAPPVEFNVRCTYGDKTVEIKNFNSYVERTVAIPDGVDPNKITTGIVVDPDGTVRHVPTRITIIDGKYHAVINSLTNSLYSVVWHPLEFKDAESHWAKDAVNDMGSRMVISGIGEGIFEPDRDITRAEFAAIMVRALGLKSGTGTNSFTDVGSSEWYSDYIKTAAKYKIITGYGSGKFGPMDKITREQAMTMIARAMKITGLKTELSGEQVETLLAGFDDSGMLAEYAKDSIAACVKAGIVSGKGGSTIAPKDNITRAEVAAIVRRLLQKSNLI